MKRFRKYSIIAVAALVVLYFSMVANPGTMLSRKACTSWGMVKEKAFMMSHNAKISEVKLPKSFKIEPGTAAQVPVLMYHYITPKANNREPGNNSVINLEAFEDGINYLHKEGYYTATLSELEQYVLGQKMLPEKSVVITFDDGYQNNYIYAYPILKKYGFHASIFVVGSKLQQKTSSFDPDNKSYLSFEEIKASSDVFEYHSHTYNLHQKGYAKCGATYASGLDTSVIEGDILSMKALGIDTPYLAYPYGERSQPMMYYLDKHGYRMAFSVRQGFVKPGDRLMNLNRLTVTNADSLAKLLQP